MKNKIIPILIVINALMVCGSKVTPLTGGFSSPKALVEYHLGCIAANDEKCFSSALLTRQEFRSSVYPYLPEAKEKGGGISEADYWAWTVPDRAKAVRAVFTRFGGARLVKVNIEKPRKIIDAGPIRILRDIPIFADFENPQTKTVHSMITTDLFKAVVEIQGKYKLWNSTYE